MDHVTSMRNASSQDMLSKCHPGGVDFFSTQTGLYHLGQYGSMSSVSGPDQVDLHPPAYTQPAGLHYGHNLPQGYNSNMAERQMASSVMCQNQSHYHTDQFYSPQHQTQPFYSQKHQPVHNQTLQSPTSPCRSQVSSVNIIPSQSPQYTQSSQVSPRLGCHQQITQGPLINGQKNQQIQSLHSHQRQPVHQMRGNPQLQRPQLPSKTVMHNQQNSPKDNTSDGHFYSTQRSPINNSPHSGMLTAQGSLNNFNHRMQLQSPAHVPHGVFPMGAVDSGSKINCDSPSHNLLGASMKGHTVSQNKPGPFMSPNSTAHHNTSSSMPQSRYCQGSNISDAQRFQKPTPFTSSMSHRLQGPSNPSSCAVYSMLPEHNIGSNRPHASLSSKAAPNKTIANSSAGISSSGRNDHCISRSQNTVPGSVSGHAPFLESSHRSDSANQHSPFSVAAFNESSRRSGRGSKVNDVTAKESSRAGGQAMTAQKDMCENTSPVQWYRCPDIALASSFQSDIEAMQADAYIAADETPAVSARAIRQTVESPAQRYRESQTSSHSGSNQTPRAFTGQKNSSSSNTSQTVNPSSKPGSISGSNSRRAEALAAIQIKQELVESLSKYRTMSSGESENGLDVSRVSAANATTTSASITPTAISNNGLTVKQTVSLKNTERSIPPRPNPDVSPRRHSSVEVDMRNQSFNSLSYGSVVREKMSEANKTALCSSGAAVKPVNIQINSGSSTKVINNSYAGDYPACVKVAGNSRNDQHVSVQNRRRTLPCPINGDLSRIRNETVGYGQSLLESSDQRGALLNNKKEFDMRAAGHHKNSSKEGIGCNSTSAALSGCTQLQDHFLNVGQGTTEQSSSNFTLCAGTRPKTAISAHKMVNVGKIMEDNRQTRTICYVMFHGYVLICLKSSVDTLLLLPQFLIECFPDKTVESINNCIDQSLSINRKILDHPEKERIVMFLKKYNHYIGDMVQTISLNDARQVYHHMYSITSCTDSTCLGEVLDREVDLNMIVSQHRRHPAREMKQEKGASDSSYGKSISSINHGTFSGTSAEKEPCQKRTDAQTSAPKTLKSKLSTCPSQLLPAPPSGQRDDQTQSNETCIYNDSDDLILVEASEDPYVIRWSEGAPKARGLCNTAVGHLRSYTDEGEVYLVLDDLCRAFGTADFYDGLERENIILYSCSQEVASFLNEIGPNFPPIQSLHHSLVKAKEIGIYITDQNYVPVQGSSGKENLGSSSLKRPLCKQEIIDDDSSSAKQIRLEDGKHIQTDKQELSVTYTERESVDEPGLHLGIDLTVDLLADINKESSLDHPLTGTKGSSTICHDMVCEMQEPVEETNQSSSPSVQDCNGISHCPILLLESGEQSNIEVQTSHNEVSKSIGENILPLQINTSGQSDDDDDGGGGGKSVLSVHSSHTNVDTPSEICVHNTQHGVKGCENGILYESSLEAANGVTHSAGSASGKADLEETSHTALVTPNLNLSTPEPNNLAATHEDVSPALNECNSQGPASSVSCNNKLQRTNQNAPGSEHVGHAVSLAGNTSDNLSCLLSAHSPGKQLAVTDSEALPTCQGKVDKLEHHVEKPADEQDGSLKNGPLSSITVEAASCPIISDARAEGLKQMLSAKTYEDLLSSRSSHGSSLNENLLINEHGSGVKDHFPSISKPNVAVVKFNTETSNRTLNISTVNDMVKSLNPNQSMDNSDTDLLHRSALKDASKCDNKDQSHSTDADLHQAVTPDTSLSPEQEASVTQRMRLPALTRLEDPIPSCFSSTNPPLGTRRSLDDTDIHFLRSKDLFEAQPFCSWKAYGKLWQEHRALLGIVDILRKNLAHEKVEKEKSEKLSKYYEGLIHDIRTAFKNGNDNEPVVINDDCFQGTPADSSCHISVL